MNAVSRFATRAMRSVRFRTARLYKRLFLPMQLEVPSPHAEPGAIKIKDQTVILFVCLAQTEETVAEILRCSKDAASDTTLRPIIAADSDNPARFCASGIFFEYLVPGNEWQSHAHGTQWESYIDARLKGIRKYYRPSRIVFVRDKGAAAEAIRALADRKPRT
jgi:hypothetical protein